MHPQLDLGRQVLTNLVRPLYMLTAFTFLPGFTNTYLHGNYITHDNQNLEYYSGVLQVTLPLEAPTDEITCIIVGSITSVGRKTSIFVLILTPRHRCLCMDHMRCAENVRLKIHDGMTGSKR